jgi:hypothetical protein
MRFIADWPVVRLQDTAPLLLETRLGTGLARLAAAGRLLVSEVEWGEVILAQANGMSAGLSSHPRVTFH